MNETENKTRGFIIDEISKIANINSRFHRISSMFLDHIIMSLVIVPPLIILMLLKVNDILKLGGQVISAAFFFMMLIYINKDFLNAKSPAKRILGYQVVDRKTERSASELQCFIRNLTICLIWPIEVIVGYINPQRRIGDFIANTKVVPSEKEKLKSILTDLKSKKLKLNFVVILIIGVIYFYGVSLLMQNLS